MQGLHGSCQPGFNLKAARLIAHAPFAEVLAVVGQQPVAVLAQPGECPAYHLSAVEIPRRSGAGPDRLATGETSERNFFHRPSAQAVPESRVMYDLAVADVDSMVKVAPALGDEV